MFKLGVDVLKSNFEGLARPYKYFLVVTKSCNSRCKFCKIWTETPQGELTVPEFEKIAKNSPFLKWLNISGGEPTNRPDLPEIVDAFVKHCPDLELVNFTTNGIRSQHIADQVRAISKIVRGKFVVNVSLDGPPDLHEKLRGIENNFDLAVSTFKLLRQIPGVSTYLAFTFYGPNNDQFFTMFDEVKKHIPDITTRDFHLNLPQNSDHFYGNSTVKTNFDSRAIDSIAEFDRRNGFDFNLLKMFEKTYRKKALAFFETKKMPMTCASLLSSVYISEMGDVYPCTIWDKKLGSLRDTGYDMGHIIDTEIYKKTRQDIRADNCPKCWTPCEAFQSIAANLHKLEPF